NQTVVRDAEGDSGVDEISPWNAYTHGIPYPNKRTRTKPATISAAFALNEKPTMKQTASIVASAITFIAMSLKVRPASTAERAMGSERKRSIRPLRRSSEMPSEVA